MVPHFLVESGIIGALERHGRCLGWLLVVLLRRAEMRHRMVTASWRTLCREAGIAKHETLRGHLRKLSKPRTVTVDGRAVTIPALLHRHRTLGSGRAPTRWVFRTDGLTDLAAAAKALLTAEAARRAAIRETRAAAGRKGMRSRWGRTGDNKSAGRGTFVTKPLKAKGGNNKSPDRGNRR